MNVARSFIVLLFLTFFLLTGFLPVAQADVESTTVSSLNLDHKPLGVTTDMKGANIYILTPGEVLIYTANGKVLKGRISVDKGIDGIAVSPRGDQLFLTDQAAKTLSVVRVDFVQNIDVTGNPFKGPANAPVTIAVFSDFQ